MDFLAWTGDAPLVYQVLMGLGLIALVGVVLQYTGLDLMPELPEDAGVFTLRNITAFILGLSIAAVLARYAGRSDAAALGFGLVAGSMFLALNWSMLLMFSRLSEDGTVCLDSLVGAIGQVTVPVGEGPKARGKATFTSADGRLFELAVYHAKSRTLARGTRVRLEGLTGDLAAVVEADEPSVDA